MVLPEEYKEHMKELLGGEYESFISIYDDDRERSYGLRKNLLKYNSDDYDKIIGLLYFMQKHMEDMLKEKK